LVRGRPNASPDVGMYKPETQKTRRGTRGKRK